MRRCLLLVSLAACGRIGIDEHRPAPVDVMVALACPADMTPLSGTSSVCIDLADRGGMIWLTGQAACDAEGRRYCTDAEWLEACLNATGLVDMTGDGWEWVAEQAGGVAHKRGASDCDDASSHVITDPYEVRCCGPMI